MLTPKEIFDAAVFVAKCIGIARASGTAICFIRNCIEQRTKPASKVDVLPAQKPKRRGRKSKRRRRQGKDRDAG